MSKKEKQDVVRCMNCIVQIADAVRINCRECEVILCVQCFRMGAELGDHRRGHNYEVVNGTTTCWGSEEDASLIGAVHRFKLGNWPDVVKQMKTKKSAEQVADHFDEVFVRGPIGQFALAGCQWLRTRDNYLSGGAAEILLKEQCTSPLKYQLMLQALRGSPSSDIPSISSSNLKEEMYKLTKEYIDDIRTMDIDPPIPAAKQCWLMRKSLPEMEKLDPSSDEDSGKAVGQQDFSKMFESNNTISPGTLPGTEIVPTQDVIDDAVEEEQRDNQSLLSPAKEHISRSNGGLSIQNEACKEDAGNDKDQDDKGDGNVADDGEEMRKPLIFEEPSAVFAEISPDQPSTSQCNGSAPAGNVHPSTSSATHSARRKKKTPVTTKKARRLDALEKKRQSKENKKEIDEKELKTVFPEAEIKSLRDSRPALCLDRSYKQRSLPKISQDDLDFVGYDMNREEFTEESFNDAEELVSQLKVLPPEENSKAEFVSNNIKFARVQCYIRALNKRNARRTAIMEHGKIPEFLKFMKVMTVEKRNASEIMENKSPMEKVKTLLQQTLLKEEHSQLFQNVDQAGQLKQRILRLQELQRQGVTTLPAELKGSLSPKKTKKSGNKRVIKRMNANWSAIKRQRKKQFEDHMEE